MPQLLDSLLAEIDRLKGEALVMRAGEKPCVLAKSGDRPFRGPIDWGRIEISPAPMTADTLLGMLGQILSFEQRRTLYEAGSVALEVGSIDSTRRFIMEASRNRGDVRLEIRPVGMPSVVESLASLAPTIGAGAPSLEGGASPAPTLAGGASSVAGRASPAPTVAADPPSIVGAGLAPPDAGASPVGAGLAPPDAEGETEPEPMSELDFELLAELEAEPETEEQPGAVILPHARPARQPTAAPVPERSDSAVVDALRQAMARGASRLHASAGHLPRCCVDGRMVMFGIEAAFSAGDLQRFTLEFRPPNAAGQTGWSCTIAGVGPVTCVGLDDDPEAGLVVHLPAALRTADELELEPAVRALASEADGLILIAGPRSGGKSTLVHALVDLMNRSRNDYVVTIESALRIRHEKHHAMVSQREKPGGGAAVSAAARAALREGPDVLVIDDLRSPEAIDVALDGARGGRLIVGALAAASVTDAVTRLIDGFVPSRRAEVRALVASSLRAVVAQTIVERLGGGVIGAREVLLNSPAVAPLVADGATWHLTAAIEAGRSRGMKTMADSLSALVRQGLIDVRSAGRAAPDLDALLASLHRAGIDVSGLERRA